MRRRLPQGRRHSTTSEASASQIARADGTGLFQSWRSRQAQTTEAERQAAAADVGEDPPHLVAEPVLAPVA